MSGHYPQLFPSLPTKFGRYQIEKLLGKGGMGSVFLALDTLLERKVALKFPHIQDDPHLLERFYREAKIAAALPPHDNICPIYDVGEMDDLPYICMAFIDGRPLNELIRFRKFWTPPIAAYYACKIARAVHHIHSNNIIHRDLKPGNVLVQRDSEPVIMDFGLARRDSSSDPQTRIGMFMGTPEYMSPEQIRADSNKIGPGTDVYSLGVILYELLCGRRPFRAHPDALISFILTQPAPPPTEFLPDLNKELETVCLTALAKTPEKRFSSMAEFANTLAEFAKRPDRKSKPASSSKSSKKQTIKKKNKVRKEKVRSIPPTLVDAERNVHPKTVLAPTTDKFQEELDSESHSLQDERPSDPKRQSTDVVSLLLVAVCILLIIAIGIVTVNIVNKLTTAPVSPNKKNDHPPSIPDPDDPINKDPTNQDPTKKDPPEITKPDPRKLIARTSKTVEELRKIYEGPHVKSVDRFAKAKVYHISRKLLKNQFVPDEQVFPSLAKAIENLPKGQPAILEIHDNGPLHELTVPRWQHRDILIRPGKGFRPLIVWDIAKTEKNPPPWPTHFLAVENGSLRIENIAFVAHWQHSELLKSSDFFSVTNGSLSLIGCSVSVFGQHQKQLSLCRFAGFGEKHLHRIERCYLRSENCAILNMEGTGHDVLVSDSLLVNGKTEPLILCKAGVRASTLRMLRSTAVTGQQFLSVKPLLQIEDDMNIQFLACDSLLASYGNEPAQALLDLQGPSYVQTKWSAHNCLYSGWKELLRSPEKIILSNDLNEWRKRWWYSPDDNVLQNTWPSKLDSNYHYMSKNLFQVTDTPADFSAVTITGKIGCPLDKITQPELKKLNTLEKLNSPASSSKTKPIITFGFTEPDNTPQFIGTHQPAKEYPDTLLRNNPKLNSWRVVDKNQKQIFSGERLVSLPGFDCHILTSTGVKLNLRGVIKGEQLPPSENVRESVITIHKNDKMALDLTFHRGRIFLTNDTDTPKYVRVRFADTTVPSLKRFWDIRLKKDSNVMLEKWARFSLVTEFDPNRSKKQRVGPISYIQIVVFKGKVDFILDGKLKELKAPKNGKPGPAYVLWDSQSGTVPDPIVLDSIIRMEQITQLNLADKDAKFQQDWKASQERIHAANKMIAAKLSDKSPKNSPELVWQSLLSSNDVVLHILGVRCLGATEDIGKLRELLGQPKNPSIRAAASDTLRFWMGSDRNNQDILYGELKKEFTELKAEKIMSLLFSFKYTLDIPAQRKETFLHLVDLLNADSLIIRDLAHEQLYERIPKMMGKELIDRQDKKGFEDFVKKFSKALSIPYDAEGTSESWEAAQMMWADLINGDLLLPPKKK